MRTFLPIFALLLAGACQVTPVPHPSPAPDSTYCAQMCAHIGPSGLGCLEGNPVYDSSLPGPRGVPNESCADFCTKQEANGVFINPKCVMKVTSCADIEDARQGTCP
jgi:hypothetical protein